MRIETQFSVFMINKPGMLAKVFTELADAKVNIVALTVMDSVEHGVMRVIGGSREKMRKVLAKLNMPYSETDVLCVTLANKAGAFAHITQKLAEAHVNISYAYCTAGARGGRTTGILKIVDLKKAMKVLTDHTEKTSKSAPKVRHSPSARR